jgi:ribosomal protein L11 methyltransferase
MPHYRIDIAIDEDSQDMFLAQLYDQNIDFDGLEQTTDAVQIYVALDAGEFEMYSTKLQSLCAEHSLGGVLGHVEIENKNWNEEWERGLKAVDVPPFFIKPDVWQGEVPAGRTVIRINPKMAFGTGYHQTTRLVLRMIAEYTEPNDFVIDAGTGTGILAIAALKHGASNAIGFDIDTWCDTNARENAELNEVTERFEVRIGSTEQLADQKPAQLFLANINKNALIELLPIFSEFVAKKGRLILSGLLDSDRDDIMNVYILKNSYNFLQIMQEGEWIALAFQKN